MADILAIAASEIGALSERRSALLIDSNLSKLPAFLVDGGVNSGFMLAQVTVPHWLLRTKPWRTRLLSTVCQLLLTRRSRFDGDICSAPFDRYC